MQHAGCTLTKDEQQHCLASILQIRIVFGVYFNGHNFAVQSQREAVVGLRFMMPLKGSLLSREIPLQSQIVALMLIEYRHLIFGR